jgi:hypothetical protein
VSVAQRILGRMLLQLMMFSALLGTTVQQRPRNTTVVMGAVNSFLYDTITINNLL